MERGLPMSQMTKRALEASLKELLRHKPLDKITVSDLTDHCGVNRMTFYYHFKDYLRPCGMVLRGGRCPRAGRAENL